MTQGGKSMCTEQNRESAGVLIIDDDEGILTACREILEPAGYRVLDAGEGGQGIAVFRAEHEVIDVIIMDWIMPGLEGHHWIEPILAIDPQVKLIFCTGHAINQTLRAELDSRGIDLLKKPFDAQQLLAIVGKALGEEPAEHLVPAEYNRAGS